MNPSDYQIILKIYEIVKSWLEYAERKNAILFTIVGLELAVLQFIDKQTSFKFLEITIIFLICAFFLALISFYPKTDRLLFLKKSSTVKIINELNLVFYGDIQKLNIESYIKLIVKNYGIKIENDKLGKDLCDQIVIISKIASSKFSIFKYAVYFTIFGQITLILIIAFNKLFIR